MEIIFNKNCVETKEIDGEPCILLTELINLSGVHFTQIYQKLRQKYSLHKYIRGGCRKRYITLEGCIKILESFGEPNDALINVFKDCLYPKKTETETLALEKFVDVEMKRLDNEKLDFGKLEERVKKLEDDVFCIDAKLIDVVDRLIYIENNLSYLNDKPNQQDTSFKTLLKECIKEIIREELTNERA